MKILSQFVAVTMGYDPDKRRRRRQHRRAARSLLKGGTFLNSRAPRSATTHAVAQWHLNQARRLGR